MICIITGYLNLHIIYCLHNQWHYLSHNGIFKWHTLALRGVDRQNLVIDFLVKGDGAGVVKHRQQMCLDGVRV